MGELATVQPLWLPNEAELSARTRTKAFAIDPHNPVEIDDAMRVEHISATEHRVAVFIGDIGLIAGETEALDLARARGWTRYAEKRGEKDVTMFDSSVYVPLGLDQRHHGIGAPAVRIAFSINPQTASWGELEFDKVAVKTTCFSYEQSDRLLAKGHKDLQRVADTGEVLAQAIGNSESISSSSSCSRELVARFMVMANHVAAEEMERLGVPWLYRNHGLQAIENIRHITDEDRDLFKKFMRAIYGSDRLEHVGLGLTSYCHLTSGFRRFPDTANGLNLDALIEGDDPFYDHAEMAAIGDEMTEIYRKEMIRRPPKRRGRSTAEAA